MVLFFSGGFFVLAVGCLAQEERVLAGLFAAIAVLLAYLHSA